MTVVSVEASFYLRVKKKVEGRWRRPRGLDNASSKSTAAVDAVHSSHPFRSSKFVGLAKRENTAGAVESEDTSAKASVAGATNDVPKVNHRSFDVEF